MKKLRTLLFYIKTALLSNFFFFFEKITFLVCLILQIFFNILIIKKTLRMVNHLYDFKINNFHINKI